MEAKIPARTSSWLFGFAVATAFFTFLLLGLGGLVTSHEAGMSVPDWPNTYGYNLFLFPPAQWIGGIFYEHTHRLLASAVGLMTTILAVWLWFKDSRPWMRWLGVTAFLLVVAQGVLGGLRVTLHLDALGIFHGTIAQLFFVLTCALALFTSRFWAGLVANPPRLRVPAGLRTLVLGTTLLILGQLMLGATMRHQHAGLAIPDFPRAYGSWWPDTSPDAVAGYNAHRVEINGENPITPFQIELQMVHRLMALAIFILVAVCAWQARRRLGGADWLAKLAASWLGLILAQVALGAATIWFNKAADVATLHVLVGALSLTIGALWCILGFHRSEPLTETQPLGAFGAQAALAANK
jgi:cytochrome c oxidase assembly protein subunit 15